MKFKQVQHKIHNIQKQLPNSKKKSSIQFKMIEIEMKIIPELLLSGKRR